MNATQEWPIWRSIVLRERVFKVWRLRPLKAMTVGEVVAFGLKQGLRYCQDEVLDQLVYGTSSTPGYLVAQTGPSSYRIFFVWSTGQIQEVHKMNLDTVEKSSRWLTLLSD